MKVSGENVGDVRAVAVEGQVNGANADALQTELLKELDEGARLVALDLSGVDYISSAGLRVVLLLAKKLADGGALVLFGLQQGVYEVFEMCGFVDILTIVKTRDEALNKLVSPP